MAIINFYSRDCQGQGASRSLTTTRRARTRGARSSIGRGRRSLRTRGGGRSSRGRSERQPDGARQQTAR